MLAVGLIISISQKQMENISCVCLFVTRIWGTVAGHCAIGDPASLAFHQSFLHNTSELSKKILTL